MHSGMQYSHQNHWQLGLCPQLGAHHSQPLHFKQMPLCGIRVGALCSHKGKRERDEKRLTPTFKQLVLQPAATDYF